MHLQYGVRTVNELRSDIGLSPVPWGNEPYKPNVKDREVQKYSRRLT